MTDALTGDAGPRSLSEVEGALGQLPAGTPIKIGAHTLSLDMSGNLLLDGAQGIKKAQSLTANWGGGLVVANGTWVFAGKLDIAYTINSLDYEVGSAGGSFTAEVGIASTPNGTVTAVAGLSAVAVSSATLANVAATGANAAAAGSRIVLIISAASGSPTGAVLTLHLTPS